MRRLRYICVVLVLLAAIVSCKRRPFAEEISMVNIVLKINTKIVNHSDVELPEFMRVDLYDPQTAQLVYTDYVGPHGGYIGPKPGLYDMIVYSIGSESTIIHNEHNYNEIEAYTNEVSPFLKAQMAGFLAKRAQAAQERAQQKLLSQTQTKEPVPAEPIVNQPDHMFVGWVHNLEIPVVYEHESTKEVIVNVDAHTIVETWKVEVQDVEGTEWIRETISLMSGQKGSVHIGPNKASEKVVSVYFDMKVEEKEDGSKSLMGKFNTFGRHPDLMNEVSLDFNVKDVGGGEQMFHFDVSDQFIDNEERYILVTGGLEIEQPKVEGGGFQPVVDDWEEIRTDINL